MLWTIYFMSLQAVISHMIQCVLMRGTREQSDTLNSVLRLMPPPLHPALPNPFSSGPRRPQDIFPQSAAHLAVTRLAEAFSSAKLPVRSVFRDNDPSMGVRDPPSPFLLPLVPKQCFCRMRFFLCCFFAFVDKSLPVFGPNHLDLDGLGKS